MTKRTSIMRDYASTDSCSVHAMLNGYGDGRERKWLNFLRKMARKRGKSANQLEIVLLLNDREMRKATYEFNSTMRPGNNIMQGIALWLLRAFKKHA